jgi:hypothetical protein
MILVGQPYVCRKAICRAAWYAQWHAQVCTSCMQVTAVTWPTRLIVTLSVLFTTAATNGSTRASFAPHCYTVHYFSSDDVQPRSTSCPACVFSYTDRQGIPNGQRLEAFRRARHGKFSACHPICLHSRRLHLVQTFHNVAESRSSQRFGAQGVVHQHLQCVLYLL